VQRGRARSAGATLAAAALGSGWSCSWFASAALGSGCMSLMATSVASRAHWHPDFRREQSDRVDEDGAHDGAAETTLIRTNMA